MKQLLAGNMLKMKQLLAGNMLKMKQLFIKIGDWPGPIKLL